MNASFTCSKVHSKEEKKKQKKSHNRKQEEERELADSAEARCRIWLDDPPFSLARAGGRVADAW